MCWLKWFGLSIGINFSRWIWGSRSDWTWLTNQAWIQISCHTIWKGILMFTVVVFLGHDTCGVKCNGWWINLQARKITYVDCSAYKAKGGARYQMEASSNWLVSSLTRMEQVNKVDVLVVVAWLEEWIVNGVEVFLSPSVATMHIWHSYGEHFKGWSFPPVKVLRRFCCT